MLSIVVIILIGQITSFIDDFSVDGGVVVSTDIKGSFRRLNSDYDSVMTGPTIEERERESSSTDGGSFLSRIFPCCC